MCTYVHCFMLNYHNWPTRLWDTWRVRHLRQNWRRWCSFPVILHDQIRQAHEDDIFSITILVTLLIVQVIYQGIVGCTPIPTYPYGKSLYSGCLWVIIPKNPYISPISTMGTLLGAHPIVPWTQHLWALKATKSYPTIIKFCSTPLKFNSKRPWKQTIPKVKYSSNHFSGAMLISYLIVFFLGGGGNSNNNSKNNIMIIMMIMMIVMIVMIVILMTVMIIIVMAPPWELTYPIPFPVWWDMLILWMLIPQIITILVRGNRCQKHKQPHFNVCVGFTHASSHSHSEGKYGDPKSRMPSMMTSKAW